MVSNREKNVRTLWFLFHFKLVGDVNAQYPPVRRSIYHDHMKRWLRHFPINQIHVVNGDAFIMQPWIELQKVEKFLQIDPVITENNFFFNSTKGFYCGRDVRIKGVWSCVKEKCLSKAKGRPKPPLKEGTVKALTEYFKLHNNLFYKLINQTFSWPIWNMIWIVYDKSILIDLWS